MERNTRLTLQATPRNKVTVFSDFQGRKWDQMSSTRAPESPQHYDFPKTQLSTAGWTSPVTNKLLIDVRATASAQNFNDRFPDPSYTGPLEFGKPIPAVYSSLIAVTEQGGLIPVSSIAAPGKARRRSRSSTTKAGSAPFRDRCPT